MRRSPSTLVSTTSASIRISGWGISPLGDALPMLPPMVALLRRAIAPIRDAASFKSSGAMGERAISAEVVHAPISTLPSGSARMPLSSLRLVMMSTSPLNAGVTPAPMLFATIRSEPPARTVAPVSLRIRSASSSVSGMKHFTCSIRPLLSSPRVGCTRRSGHSRCSGRCCR